jgi:hypothetical protein
MTPFVEAARQIVRGIQWLHNPISGSFAGHGLQWRHHGLGMLQAELSETLRIHVWHPKLVSEGMAWPRCVHDHRFDIHSAVVVGGVIDVPCYVSLSGHRTPTEAGWDNVNVYEIEHAKNQDRLVLEKGCSTATSAKKLAQGSVYQGEPVFHKAGGGYLIERRHFHTTRVDDLAITVVHRSNFDDRLARVLCAPDKDVTAVSGIVRDESLDHRVLCNWVLREASDAIANMG